MVWFQSPSHLLYLSPLLCLLASFCWFKNQLCVLHLIFPFVPQPHLQRQCFPLTAQTIMAHSFISTSPGPFCCRKNGPGICNQISRSAPHAFQRPRCHSHENPLGSIERESLLVRNWFHWCTFHLRVDLFLHFCHFSFNVTRRGLTSSMCV